MDIHYRIHKGVTRKLQPLDPQKQSCAMYVEDICNFVDKCFDKDDLIIHPLAFYRQYTRNQIQLMMKKKDIYVLPTEELCAFLDELISDKSAIEIGAGKGYLGRELSIPITDSYAKRDPYPMMMDRICGVPTITYPPDVEKLDAISSVRKYRPHTVIASFLVHEQTYKDGSKKFGLDGKKLLHLCKRYIHIGNLGIHCNNPILTIPHTEIEFPYLITNIMSPLTDRIFIWGQDGMSDFEKNSSIEKYIVRYEAKDKGIFEIDFMSSNNNIENRARYWIEVDLHTRFMTGKIPFRLISIEQHERQR